MSGLCDIERTGSLVFEKSRIPFTDEEWCRLQRLVMESEYEHIIGGDANESHSVWVSRYVNDIRQPVALNETAKKITEIVMSDKMRRFYASFTGTETLCLRRCQANRMFEGDYIGMHKDQDSNPDYYATIIFHLRSDYRGGRFETGDGRCFHPPCFSALANDCAISHQVTPVESGERLTLACFLSKSFAENRKNRYRFRIGETKKPLKS